jgi:hypothetical protein
MLLTLRTTHVPATDLGFLPHEHPDRVRTFELPVGAPTAMGIFSR